MLPLPRPVEERTGLDARALPEDVLRSEQPLVLPGLVADWPATEAGRQSPEAMEAYLRRFHRGAAVDVLVAPPDSGGRIFYNEDLSGFNFNRSRQPLDAVLTAMQQCAARPVAPAIYVGSTTIDTCLPGFRDENVLEFGDRDPLASVWIGNRARIAAHYDVPDNLACVVAGRRRFTLFPPGQLGNLYVGPVDFTPAGQAVSLVDFHDPDLERFPRFADAMAHAQVAELDPGDAIFIPGMWWHHIESLAAFNVLVNYWWRQSPEFMDSPIGALMLAMLSVRDLPAPQRDAMREMFRHYVFEADSATAAHIPERARGILGPIDENSARALRALLLKRLNR